ncbi:probable insertion sequence transposase protein [Roseobacter sp. AzwK-3b]|uniref:IS66 family transposase n=1 Tax=Roseobacter sp. AzwK-3b TaxID=351016 RepID=UPI00015690AE|nr:IS66 family transposase [Roseobacter sp. AzwK-3b]EDM69601.1 probable insertion sequence transposase protein [Roseobacter sp. AzwK-3b]EDM69628.1 probable insertion sequence transposase protein [Roseobacter sp. AzwK-3b]EDM69844.1 probable insertion sequence transposase protein [Roseobacter sp. AzwK-3b]EDM69897.1 probable insertion sequence transposase protein [Roseobacter sp. AzwK-3b]EDM69973.1 probable insertion sequence transposase protein [Roseobacter sp. AzwK-3b]
MQTAPQLDLSAIPAAQRAAVLALMEKVAALTEITQRQEHLIAELNHALHGKRSEKLTEDERQLAFEDLSIALAEVEVQKEHLADRSGDKTTTKPAPKRTIGNLPTALPRIEEVIEPESLICPCGCGVMHKIGEDRSERLDIVPAQLRVIVTVRPKYACRTCTDGVTQAPAPSHLIMGGLPTEATIAHVLVSKYADHLPLYRQSQILARAGLDLHRAVLADWVGKAAFHLKPVVDRLTDHLKRSSKLFMDETTAPVLDPGRGKTKTGYLWALARDDRPWGGEDPPGVVYFYAPGRAGQNAETFLTGFDGILQIDGYQGYNRLTKPTRKGGNPIRVAHCWAHARRKLNEVFDRDRSEIAAEGLRRIAGIYAVEADIRGISPGQRLSARQTHSAPLVAAFGDWLQAERRKVSAKSRLGEKLTYIHNHWDGLQTFLADGRVEIDNNRVENMIRPIALNRKNSLFAGHDEGGIAWGRIASLIETCKINGVEPFAYLKATLTAIANGHPQNHIEDLLPWNFKPSS